MCWIIPLIVGILSALLGYWLGSRFSADVEALEALQGENQTLSKQLKSRQIEDSKSLSNDAIEGHAHYQTLLADYEVSQNALAEMEKAKESAEQAKADAENAEPSEEKVVAHAAYQALQASLAQQSEANDKLFEANKNLLEKTQHPDDDVVKKHAVYKELLTEYDQKIPTDEEVRAHPVYKSLVSQSEEAAFDYQFTKQENARLQAALDNARETVTKSSGSSIEAFAASVDEAVEKPFDADVAKTVFGKKIKENDLTVVEGIGPKIAELFKKAGIDTWHKLGETGLEDCQRILNNAGERYTIHDPATWSRQARLAADGEWQALFDWQEKLDGGREV